MSGNTRDFKVKNGIQPTSYFEGVGTVVSGQQGYALSEAVYDSVSFDLSSQDTNPRDLVFSGDGTKMYIYGGQSSRIYQYSLSTGFDLSTASYDSVSFDFSSQGTGGPSLALSNDGTKLFVFTYSNKTVFQYSLSTAFDLSTASYDSISFSVGSQDTDTNDITFNNAGTKMYMVGNTNNSVFQYSLSTAFDLSTASYDSVSFSFSSQDTSPYDMAFNSNGTKMYMVGTTDDTIYQYSLSTAFDVGTASYDSISFTLTISGIACTGMFFGSNGTKLYVLDVVTDSIYQYSTALNTATLDLSTGSVFEVTPTSDIQVTLSNPADSGTVRGATLLLDGAELVSNTWDISTAAYSQNFSFSSQASSMRTGFFKPDGTKLYMGSISTNSIYEYDLSTAWDVSTSVYSTNSKDISSQETSVSGLFFKTDGTKMYLCGKTGDDVNEYNLSTAWDVSTATYNQNFSVSGQEANPSGLFFRADGLKMYVAGASGDDVNEYTLSTAWDISSASYVQNFSFSSRDTDVGGIFFKEDGLKMFHLGDQNNKAYEYDLSTAWNVSTASFVQDFDVSSQEIYPKALSFKANGSKMFVFGEQGNDVSEYTVGSSTNATITYPSTVEWPSGTAPTSPAIGETDIITFNTRDGGSTYSGVLAIDGAS